MNEKVIKRLIVVLVIIVMFIPIIIEVVTKNWLTEIKFSELDKTAEKTANFASAFIYVAPSSDKEIDKSKKEMKELALSIDEKEEILTPYYLDYDKLSNNEKEEIFGESTNKTAYIFMYNGEKLKTVTNVISTSKLKDYVKTYSANGISSDLKHYKTVDTAAEYSKLVKRKKDVTMAVFGRDSCYWCNQFKVIYNNVAEEKDLDIYYFDSDSYNKDEYNKIMDLGLKIPASCSDTKEEVALQTGFGTPLTLFTKNGKVIDCIAGFIDKKTLITKLETVGMIKEN